MIWPISLLTTKQAPLQPDNSTSSQTVIDLANRFFSWGASKISPPLSKNFVSIEIIPDEDFNISIDTARTHIRPAEIPDQTWYADLFQDPEVYQLNGDLSPFSYDYVLDLLEQNGFANASPLGQYTVTEKNGGSFIGTFSLRKAPTDEKAITVGLALNKKFQRKGYGTEIGNAILNLIKTLHTHGYLKKYTKVQAISHIQNIGSQKIQERMGLKPVIPKDKVPFVTFEASLGNNLKLLP
ncbi:MAG: hypothetical protein COT85_07120 [Chlamydiae bacterium CG10_big_fil_rev_8_21_14_0_10_42_34]|nr:MAG: hypothetical protein COT85_07120 [Chlamydiae bacterium CG10_big_fil_rev_8_21_14_0_10_42_34]